MKKILPAILILFTFSNISFALIPTLTQANAGPAIGDVLTLYTADTNQTEGSSGAAQSWVFQNLTINTASPSVTTGVTVASTPFAANFPTANVAQTANGAYQYFNCTSSILQQLGSAQSPQVMILTTPIDFMTFPFTFNSSAITPNFAGTHAQGTVTGSNTTTADAYGSISINGQTFSDVLRLNVVQDMDIDYTSIGHLYYHTVTYMWYDGIHTTPVMEIVTSDISGLSAAHIKQVLVGSFATGIEKISATGINMNVFPNPAHDETNISFSLNKSADVMLKIYDYTGSEVMIKNFSHLSPAERKETIDLSSLSRGVYTVEIIADELKEVRRVVVQ